MRITPYKQFLVSYTLQNGGIVTEQMGAESEDKIRYFLEEEVPFYKELLLIECLTEEVYD